MMDVSPDKNVERNRQLLLDRSKVGFAKYGVTTERTDLELADWLQHALEETLDLANYLQAAKNQVQMGLVVEQSRKDSFLETVVSVGIGMIIAYLAQMFLFWYYDVTVSENVNLAIVFWMTVLSILRGYIVRRFFSKKEFR